VVKIATQARAKQLVLTHFRQNSEDTTQEMMLEIAGDYAGPVIMGKDLLEVLL
jgi:ribonuclease BN (tRNA processing enzyme)